MWLRHCAYCTTFHCNFPNTQACVPVARWDIPEARGCLPAIATPVTGRIGTKPDRRAQTMEHAWWKSTAPRKTPLSCILQVRLRTCMAFQIFLNTGPNGNGNFKMINLQLFSSDRSQTWAHWLPWQNIGCYFSWQSAKFNKVCDTLKF